MADGLLNVLLRGGMHVAMEMFSTADPVSAERALALRLVNHLVPEAELEAFTFALAGTSPPTRRCQSPAPSSSCAPWRKPCQCRPR